MTKLPAVIESWVKQMLDTTSPITARLEYERRLIELRDAIDQNLARFRRK